MLINIPFKRLYIFICAIQAKQGAMRNTNEDYSRFPKEAVLELRHKALSRHKDEEG